jgi:hypothetical protein
VSVASAPADWPTFTIRARGAAAEPDGSEQF